MKDHQFLIASRRCDQCLFGPNKIVSDSRKEDVLRGCEAQDRHFVCHKSSIRDPEEGMVCRGFYEVHRGTGQGLRIAERLGIAAFADPNTGLVVSDAPTSTAPVSSQSTNIRRPKNGDHNR